MSTTTIRAGQKNKRKLKVNADYDYKLIACVILLAGFGLVVLYSSSYYSEGMTMLIKQAIFTVMGLVLMIVFTELDYHIFRPIAMPMFLLSLAVTMLVLIPGLGVEINGAKRWIDLKITTFQPAEFLKLAMILVLAGILTVYHKKLATLFVIILLSLVVTVPVLITFFITDNLSSAIIIFVMSYGMIFLACRDKRLMLVIGALLIAAAIWLIYYVVEIREYVPGESFRYTRIRIWFDPFNESYEKSFQVRQGLYAIATGGLFGRGLGNSMLKQGVLPEPYNDMIFAILCEEMGLFGACMVLFLFFYLISRIFRIALSAPDRFGFYICSGVMLHLASQVVLNIMVVTNTIMNTGITLCFFSGGGSSLIFIYIEMGLVLSVARRIQNPR